MRIVPTLQQPLSAAGATPGRQKTLTTMICTIPTSKLSVSDAAVTTTQVGTKNIGIAGLSSFAIISFADLVIY